MEHRKRNVKYFKLNADVVRAAEGGECHYLSAKTQQIVLPLLEMQTWQTRWEGTVNQDEIDAWIAQAAYEIQAENEDCVSECYDFGPESSNVTFAPQNPYADPYLVPDGYADAPFTVVKSTDVGLLALGLQPGDVITDLTRFPVGSLPTVVPPGGFARFRVSFIGKELELHLLQIPAGGIALISSDDDPLTVQTLDLDKDLASLPPEAVTVTTHQMEWETTGAHFVDVTFIPWVNDEAPFLKYGGGIRSFTVCGAFGNGENMDVRQNTESPCLLEKTFDGETWVQFADISLCKPTTQPPKPTTGDFRVVDDKLQWSGDGGTTWTDTFQPPDNTPVARRPDIHPGDDDEKRCLAAANATNVLAEFYRQTYGALAAGLSNSINTLSNFLTDVTGVLVNMVFPYWESSVLGAWLFEPQYRPTNYTAPDLSSAAREALQCLLYCNASVLPDGRVTFDFGAVRDNVISELGINPGTAIWSQLLYIQSVGLDAAGGTSAIASAWCACPDCEPDDGVWCYAWDFLSASGSEWWSKTTMDANTANTHWMSGSGWASGGCISGISVAGVQIEFDEDQVISRVKWSVRAIAGFSAGNTQVRMYDAANAQIYINTPSSPTTGVREVTMNVAGVRKILVSVGGYPCGGTDVLRIESVELAGTGYNPIGGDNC